jgi:peptidoglycan hydrolase-like protein with peptidoglycan-binding domain
MKKIIFVIFISLFLSVSFNAQTTAAVPTSTPKTSATKKPIFRATKDQIIQVQKMLKSTETGKMDDDFRAAVKKYQPENGLKATGTLNRATLEKMGIALTDKQKEFPVDPNSLATEGGDKMTKTTKRGPVFRANKEQVTAAQNMLKTKNLYSGEATGKLDPATRASLKAYQEANSLKGTGTLNQATLEKMGIALTDKQKENAAKVMQ